MKKFIAHSDFLASTHDSVCNAFGLELCSGEFEIQYHSWGMVVVMNTATDQSTYDISIENGCHVFREAC